MRMLNAILLSSVFGSSRATSLNGEEGESLFLELWSKIYGLISLYNSGILSEINDTHKEIIEKIVKRTIISLTKND